MPPVSLLDLMLDDLRRYEEKRTGIWAFVLSYLFAPGFAVLTRHRVAAALYRHGKVGRILGLLVWRHNVRVSGCHLGLLCELGGGLFLPHATGIVIGDHIKVGRNSIILQNVTLGLGRDGGYPELGEGVTVYAGAVVVGAIHIGDGARVGANAFVAKSVPPRATVVGVPARQLGTPGNTV